MAYGFATLTTNGLEEVTNLRSAQLVASYANLTNQTATITLPSGITEGNSVAVMYTHDYKNQLNMTWSTSDPRQITMSLIDGQTGRATSNYSVYILRIK